MLLGASLFFNPDQVRIDSVRDAAFSWHIPVAAAVLRGARLYMDAPRGGGQLTATVRNILRTNPRLGPTDALALAAQTLAAARRQGIDPGFLAATLLQESAFAPRAISAAGAIGIGQFTVGTADAFRISDPWDPHAAIDATASVLATYVAGYRRNGARDPYAFALAAYNAGPLAVARYDGIPPFAETREYVRLIYERWSRIARDR
jgi:soluble lytic murein transglycosylase-like protein